MMDPSRPSSSSTGGRSWADEAADVAQLPAQQLAQEAAARCGPCGGSDSKTRSMNSTWKIAFESACAGPSWTSWARRARSASWASTIRIWSSVETTGSAGSVTSVVSPRSRNSHVVSRLRIASSRRESSASWAPRSLASPVHLAAHRPQPEVGRAGLGRPGRAAGRRRPRDRRSSRRHRRARARRGRRRGPATGTGRRGRPRDSGRGRRAGCWRRTRAPPSPRRAARRTGCPPVRSEERPSRRV